MLRRRAVFVDTCKKKGCKKAARPVREPEKTYDSKEMLSLDKLVSNLFCHRRIH